jgi:predicted MFS family arabinose efflux permease
MAPVLGRRAARGAFLFSLLATAITLLALALTSSLGLIATLRFLSGVSGAGTVVIGGGLVVQVCGGKSRRMTGIALATFFGGAGAGIVLSGLTIPLLLDMGSSDAWRGGWAVIGGAALMGALLAAYLLKDVVAPPPKVASSDRVWFIRSLGPTFVAYGLYGVGYMSFMTFIIAFLERTPDVSGESQVFWILLGTAAVVSSVAWGPTLGELNGGRGTAAAMAVLTVGTALPLLDRGSTMITFSALLCGASFLAVASAVTVVAGRSLGAAAATPAVASLTIVFAVGQCLGPAVTGFVADHAGGIRTGLVLSTTVLAIGSLSALAQRESHQ